MVHSCGNTFNYLVLTRPISSTIYTKEDHSQFFFGYRFKSRDTSIIFIQNPGFNSKILGSLLWCLKYKASSTKLQSQHQTTEAHCLR